MGDKGRRLRYTVQKSTTGGWEVSWSEASPHLKKPFDGSKAAIEWAIGEANIWWIRQQLKADVLVKDPTVRAADYLFHRKASGKWVERKFPAPSR